jgi:hypothetical protein
MSQLFGGRPLPKLTDGFVPGAGRKVAGPLAPCTLGIGVAVTARCLGIPRYMRGIAAGTVPASPVGGGYCTWIDIGQLLLNSL